MGLAGMSRICDNYMANGFARLSCCTTPRNHSASVLEALGWVLPPDPLKFIGHPLIPGGPHATVCPPVSEADRLRAEVAKAGLGAALLRRPRLTQARNRDRNGR